jgi:hemerythrin-like metal-binding protein
MNTIQWHSDFETGIPEIDLQHRVLIARFNEANATLHDHSGLEVWEHFTYDLLSYALYHFSTEEKQAADYGYDQEERADAQAHCEQHRSFATRITNMRQQLHAGERPSRAEFLGFLSDWLVKHILHTDKRLGAFIAAKRRLARG